MKAIVSEKGQVTIPKRLRERLGIRPGETLEFEDDDGRLIATKASDRDPVDELYGVLALEGGTDAWMNELRGDPPT
ncbi:MAG: AbrB/MazE/SpoVT family DNA-binding domain-containing protein [Thermoleophilaceae bacterium]|jgi:AbrB family looped-hinge helix DNA binding protein|nr:AbrB/MazE/SpoVT family DNA-binding domain-containing protein [Thermoleophilaceae bacterium]